MAPGIASPGRAWTFLGSGETAP